MDNNSTGSSFSIISPEKDYECKVSIGTVSPTPMPAEAPVFASEPIGAAEIKVEFDNSDVQASAVLQRLAPEGARSAMVFQCEGIEPWEIEAFHRALCSR